MDRMITQTGMTTVRYTLLIMAVGLIACTVTPTPTPTVNGEKAPEHRLLVADTHWEMVGGATIAATLFFCGDDRVVILDVWPPSRGYEPQTLQFRRWIRQGLESPGCRQILSFGLESIEVVVCVEDRTLQVTTGFTKDI